MVSCSSGEKTPRQPVIVEILNPESAFSRRFIPILTVNTGVSGEAPGLSEGGNMKHLRSTLILTVGLLSAAPVLAEGTDVVGKVGAQDWIDRLPIIYAASVFVIVVDAVFVIPAIRKLRTLKRS